MSKVCSAGDSNYTTGYRLWFRHHSISTSDSFALGETSLGNILPVNVSRIGMEQSLKFSLCTGEEKAMDGCGQYGKLLRAIFRSTGSGRGFVLEHFMSHLDGFTRGFASCL